VFALSAIPALGLSYWWFRLMVIRHLTLNASMTERSIAAYDVSQRVKTYDADMELMHPNRSKMVQIAIEVLPFSKTATLFEQSI
jgi:hypothetical protein